MNKSNWRILILVKKEAVIRPWINGPIVGKSSDSLRKARNPHSDDKVPIFKMMTLI